MKLIKLTSFNTKLPIYINVEIIGLDLAFVVTSWDSSIEE